MVLKLIKCYIWSMALYGAKLIKCYIWSMAFYGAETNKMLHLEHGFVWC